MLRFEPRSGTVARGTAYVNWPNADDVSEEVSEAFHEEVSAAFGDGLPEEVCFDFPPFGLAVSGISVEGTVLGRPATATVGRDAGGSPHEISYVLRIL